MIDVHLNSVRKLEKFSRFREYVRTIYFQVMYDNKKMSIKKHPDIILNFAFHSI